MAEYRFRQHNEVVSREHALRLAQAAEEAGSVAVRATHNEGDLYPQAPYGMFRVPEGQIRLSISGDARNIDGLHGAADALSHDKAA